MEQGQVLGMISAEDYTLIIGELYVRNRLLSQELESAKLKLEQVQKHEDDKIDEDNTNAGL